MNKMKTKSIVLLMALIMAVVISCQKTEPLETSSVEAADDATFTETLFDDAFASLEIASLFVEGGTKSSTVIDSCPLITFTFPGEGSWPRNVVIDYGEGCQGLDNIVRSGKINITLSAPRKEVGSVRILSFENYYFNDVKIEGTKTVENLGPNNSSNVVFSCTLAGGKITFPNDSTIERSFEREREYEAGYSTWNPWDDKCLITGTTTGKTYSGLSFTHTITNALVWEATCRFILGGTIRFDLEGIEPFSLDYGDGTTCDAKAVISRGDDSKEITLGFWHPKMPVGK